MNLFTCQILNLKIIKFSCYRAIVFQLLYSSPYVMQLNEGPKQSVGSCGIVDAAVS